MRGLWALGLRLDPSQVDACLWLADELLTWNRTVNLTAITDPVEVQTKHLLDSLSLVPLVGQLAPWPRARLVDVGAGAGFPALPLKIALPDLEVVAIEATGKKVRFIEHVIRGLGLEGIRAVHQRAEVFGQLPQGRESFDVAVARAVGPASVLAELLLPLVAVGRWAVLMKTRSGLEDELAQAAGALDALGGRVQEVVPVHLPGLLEGRALVVVEKLAPTPARFPRRPGVPHRRPLR